MKTNLISTIFFTLQGFLVRPFNVLILCLVMVFLSLVWEGSLWQLWTLKQESARLHSKIRVTTQTSHRLGMEIKKASDLTYIDRQARDRFDLVGKDDLIFIFSDHRSVEDASRK